MTTATISPDTLLLAILYKVGEGLRIEYGRQLDKILDNAATGSVVFKGFKAHPKYKDSKTLRELLQTFDLGGAIIRDNAPTYFFRVAKPTAGAYGASKYESLPEEVREQVEHVAQQIREQFGKTGG